MTRLIRAAAGLLLSTGPFHSGQTSFQAHGDKFFSDPDVVVVHGQLQDVHAHTLKREVLPSAAASTTTTTWLPGADQVHHDVPGVNLTLLLKTVRASAINSRNLQASGCADGTTSISVSSTVIPLMEGCLSPFVVDGAVWYTTGVATIFPLQSTHEGDPPFWNAVYLDSSNEHILACSSLESADDVNPSEATWLCDNDGGGSTYTLADEELSVSCGCESTSPPPAAIPAPTPSTTKPSCGGGASFTIVSDNFPDAEGCFVKTSTLINDQAVYTTTGTTDVGQVWVVALELIVHDTTSLIVWGLLDIISTTWSDLNEVYCVSEAAATSYHPSEVPVWQCGIDVNGIKETIGGALSVYCGCSITSPPVRVLTSALASSTTVSTCGEGDSFSIASETLPGAAGCYLDTTETTNEKTIYSTSGSSNFGQMWMVAVDLTADDPSTAAVLLWALVYVLSTDGSERNLFYCISEEDAAISHPTEVQGWICPQEVTILLACGCSSSPSPGAPPATPLPIAQPEISPTSPRKSTSVAPPLPQAPAEPETTHAARSPFAPIDQVTSIEAQLIANTCPGDGSFTITADAAPEISGCFTGSMSTDGKLPYTGTSTTTQSEIVVYLENDEHNFNWYMGYVPVSLDWRLFNGAYCSYGFDPTGAVPEQLCRYRRGLIGVSATDGSLSIACGSCTTSATTSQPAASPDSPLMATTESPPISPTAAGPPTSRALPTLAPLQPTSPTAQPSTSPILYGTPTPVARFLAQTSAGPSTTAAPSPATVGGPSSALATCSGDGSFTVKANAAPHLDGCFKDTSSLTNDGSVFYTMSGKLDTPQNVVSLFGHADGDIKWYIGFVEFGTETSESSRIYCVSQTSANVVDPGSALWGCDFSGEFGNIQDTTDEEILIECGSCTTVVPDDASPANKLGVGLMAAGWAGILAFASSYGNWC